ncbi:type VI secretion system tube protein Hcp [Glaciecola sp. MF2-115]|uniref:type VI secretion system tube protein Hcp n=1 Tax=Glaciecola sp. MF2-115 TaxID=3384827 RepID=UPI0039A0108A
MKSLKRSFTLAFVLLVGVLAIPPTPVLASVISPEVFVDNDSFQLVSSRRVARRATEYTISVLAFNEGSREFENVQAELIALPDGITLVSSEKIDFGFIGSTGNARGSENLVIRINTSLRPSLADLVWEVTGDLYVEPPPPPPTAPAEIGMFLFLGEDLPGEAQSASHRDWTKIIAWSDSARVLNDPNSPRGTFVSQDDLQFTKYLDSLSPKIRLHLAQGRFIEEIKLDIVSQCGGKLYTQYAITLIESLFSSVSLAGQSNQDKLYEEVSINSRLMETIYTPVDERCIVQTPIFSSRELTF